MTKTAAIVCSVVAGTTAVVCSVAGAFFWMRKQIRRIDQLSSREVIDELSVVETGKAQWETGDPMRYTYLARKAKDVDAIC